jgi:hypothetical protein
MKEIKIKTIEDPVINKEISPQKMRVPTEILTKEIVAKKNIIP